jgi:adhesin/invasin
MLMSRRIGRIAVVVTAVAIGAATDSCGGSNEPATFVVVVAASSVTSQNGTVNQLVGIPPAVIVTKNGIPDPGVPVTFTVATGGGSLTGGTQTTGADGVARLGSWTLGTVAGGQSLNANAGDSATGGPVTFTATASAGPLAAIVKAIADSQTSAAGVPVALASRPTVRSTDAFGNAVGGATVTFAVATGGGSVTGPIATTGVDGLATVGGWTLGPIVGTNTLTATAPTLSGSPLTFTTFGVAGPVASLVKVAGDSQTAVVGTALPILPTVRAADQFGNLVANASVAFAVSAGGGSVTGASSTTNTNGIATVGGWTLGPAVGTNALDATASSVTVTFTATGTATATFNAAPYAGTYNGTWTNTTFGSTGTANAVVTVNTANNTASVTVNVTGSVLGSGSGVSNVVESGSFTTSGVTFTGNVPPMGTMTVNGVAGSSSIAVTASGVNVPNAAISRWDATGTLTPTALQLNFTVTFTSGPPASGTISLTKP